MLPYGDDAILPKESKQELIVIDDVWRDLQESLNLIRQQPKQSNRYIKRTLTQEYKDIKALFEDVYGDTPDSDPDKARILDVFAMFEQ